MKVAIYTRVSTQEQAKEGYSIGEQIERLQKYCDAMKWSVYKVYTDAGYSGASTDRPALQQMIGDLGKVDRIVVYKLDRLSRSQLDTLYLIEKVFLANNTDFVSMSENFDTSTPFGRAMIGILAVFAQLEREQIKERMTMGKEARIKDGKWTGSVSPFGYDYEKHGSLTVNDFEAMQIKELFADFVAGKPINRICDDFNAKGYRLRNSEWTLFNARYMLKNKVYAGYIRYGDDWVKAAHAPLIDEKTYNSAVAILDDNRKRFIEAGIPIGGKTRSTYLGGLLYCAHCGGKYGKRLSGSPGTRHYTYVCYSRCKKVRAMVKDPNCKNKIYRMDELDQIVFGEIRKLAIDPDYIHEARSSSDREQLDKKIRTIGAEIKSIENQISRFMDLYGMGRFSVDQLDAKLIPLEQQKNRLTDELNAIQTDLPGITEEQAAALITSFSDVLEHGDFHEIRSVIESLIDRIVIDNDDISIHWRFT